MTAREIYLDNNASTRPLPEVREAMLNAMEEGFGNPSSAHGGGERARISIARARGAVAALIGASPETVVFTGSGTEANNWVWYSALENASRSEETHIVTMQIEHSSILKAAEYASARGCEVTYLPVNGEGRLDLGELEASLRQGTVLVSVQWINNETGVIQPVEEIASLCRRHEIPFHTDAAQAVGKVAMDLSTSGISYLTMTAHKFHGPQGVGALYAEEPERLVPLFHGGPQENGLRPGTENLPAIVGLGVAAELRQRRFGNIRENLAQLRDRFESLVLDAVSEARVNGDRANRVCNTTNLLFGGLDGQALLARLDLAGVLCSQSSACTNMRPEPSYVLRAMGLSEADAYSSIRFSFGEQNNSDEAERAAQLVIENCAALRPFSSVASSSSMVGAG